MQAYYALTANSEPKSQSQNFDETTDISTETFLSALLHGDTSDLADRFFEEEKNSKLVILDVRSPQEAEDCREMAELTKYSFKAEIINIPTSQLLHMNKKSLKRHFGVQEADTIICFCAGGNRSAQGTKKLRALGFDCYNLFGGVKKLAKRGMRKIFVKA